MRRIALVLLVLLAAGYGTGRHAGAAGEQVWYLLRPPMVEGELGPTTAVRAPLARWEVVNAYDTGEQCRRATHVGVLGNRRDLEEHVARWTDELDSRARTLQEARRGLEANPPAAQVDVRRREMLRALRALDKLQGAEFLAAKDRYDQILSGDSEKSQRREASRARAD